MSYTFEESPEFHVWDLETYDSIDSKSRFVNNHFFQYLHPEDAVLDIGCGPGYIVKILSDNNIKVLGIDLNEELINKATKNGLPVEKIDASEAVRKHGKDYNIFSMMDFVEHVPLEVVVNILTEISKLPNAKVLISTPNLDSIMGFKFWFHMPTHVNPLHPFVLRNMLNKLGFDIIDEWTEYGNLPGRGWKLWIRKKILKLLLGTQAQLFMGGANICIVAQAKEKK